MAGDPPPPSYGTADSVSEGDGKWRPQRRHVVAVLAFLGFANIYAMRANLSVAIVEMTLGTTRLVNGTLIHTEGEFKEWSSVTQGVILGSFFYGYIITQIPGGFLAHTYGGKTVFLIGIFGTAVFTLLTPPFAKMGFVMLVLARFTEGLLEGVTYPAMHVMWSYWAPSFEKTQLATFAFSGSYFGTVLSMPISAILGQHIGWPSIFYVFGLIGLLWCWAWAKKVKDTPELDQNITTDELTLLQRDASNMHTYLIPWRQILASRPVWAIVVAHFCQNWGFYTMLTCLPRILNDLAHYDLEQAGFVSGLPYLFMGASLIGSGHVADYLRKEKGIATVRVRKQFAVIGFLSQSFFLLLASFSSSSTFLVFFMSLSIGLGGLTWAGFSVNHLDLAPQFAGHLMGLSNTFATLPGMISPVIVGFVVTHNTSAEWNVIFYSTALIYSLGALCFGSWASGEVQDWASDSAPFVGQLH